MGKCLQSVRKINVTFNLYKEPRMEEILQHKIKFLDLFGLQDCHVSLDYFGKLYQIHFVSSSPVMNHDPDQLQEIMTKYMEINPYVSCLSYVENITYFKDIGNDQDKRESR